MTLTKREKREYAQRLRDEELSELLNELHEWLYVSPDSPGLLDVSVVFNFTIDSDDACQQLAERLIELARELNVAAVDASGLTCVVSNVEHDA